jgi:hypothetical protein
MGNPNQYLVSAAVQPRVVVRQCRLSAIHRHMRPDVPQSWRVADGLLERRQRAIIFQSYVLRAVRLFPRLKSLLSKRLFGSVQLDDKLR